MITEYGIEAKSNSEIISEFDFASIPYSVIMVQI